jgi:hypothetical protein
LRQAVAAQSLTAVLTEWSLLSTLFGRAGEVVRKRIVIDDRMCLEAERENAGWEYRLWAGKETTRAGSKIPTGPLHRIQRLA